MSNVNVSYEEMRTAAMRLTTGRDSINEQLVQLKSFISNLISSGFVTDQASVKFGSAYEAYSTQATGVIDTLTEISNYLNQAAATLEQTDAALASGLG